MYRVIIVEDEKLVRIGLSNAVNWAQYNMQLVAEYADGNEAYEMFTKQKPDLIITDLRMLHMHGMELISKIRKVDQDVRFIVLTCLDEKDYLHKAIQYDVTGYILKHTMRDEELFRVIEKAKIELDKMQRQSSAAVIPCHTKPQIKEKLLHYIKHHQSYSPEETLSVYNDFGDFLLPDRLAVCIMEVDNYGKMTQFMSDDGGQLTRESIVSVTEEIFEQYKNAQVFHYKDQWFLVVFNLDSDIEVLSALLRRIANCIKKFFNISVSFGLSGTCSGFDKLCELFTQAKTALTQKFFYGSGIYKYGQTTDIELVLQSFKDVEGRIRRLADTSGKNAELLYQLHYTGQKLTGDPDAIKQMYASFLARHIATKENANNSIIAQIITYNEKIQGCETLYELNQCLETLICENISTERTISREMASILRFIKDNFTKNLTLDDISAHVHFSRSYITALFKKETGSTFIDYLNSLRIEKAQDYLKNSDMRIYDIAALSGFHNESYFSRVFQRYAGMSPGEYRKKHLSSVI